MKIIAIYEKYKITPNLQEHMLRVCSIVEFIQNHWQGATNINWDSVKKIALLHDMGNIVRFDFDKYPDFLGKEKANVQYWKRVQLDMIKKYGTDENKVTKKILLEIGLESKLLHIILQKSFGNSVATSNSNNWILKILYYADLRALPFRIGSLTERLNDIKDRIPKYNNRSDFNDLVEACKSIEKQIQSQLNIPVNEISDKTTKLNWKLLDLEV